MSHFSIETIFLDVGGVLLTNGLDSQLRQKIAQEFDYEYDETTKRHEMVFDLFERGKMSFDAYLEWTIFYKERTFTLEELKSYIMGEARAHSDMIAYAKELKKAGFKIGILSNEGRELAVDRIKRFDLSSFVDYFILSSFVHFRKPDADIYRLAIDVSQSNPSQICYIDDRELLIESAKKLGVHAIHHKNVETTKQALNFLVQSRV